MILFVLSFVTISAGIAELKGKELYQAIFLIFVLGYNLIQTHPFCSHIHLFYQLPLLFREIEFVSEQYFPPY